MADQHINLVEATLRTALSSSDATCKIEIAKSMQKNDGSYYDLERDVAGDTLDEFFMIIESKGGNKKEMVKIDGVTADGTADDGRKRYILTFDIAADASTKMRGLANDYDGTNATANVISDNIIDNHPKNSKCKIAVNTGTFQRLEDLFAAGSTTASLEAGENIDALDSVSLHTDGKVYKYLQSTYPNFYGIADAAITSGSTGNITTYGGLSTGHAGLTIGGDVYADDTGQVTQTSTVTAVVIGSAESATTVRLAKTVTQLKSFPDDEFEVYDDADNTKKITFDASTISTATTREYIWPDKAGTVALLSDTAQPIQSYVASTAIDNGDAVFLDEPLAFADSDQDRDIGDHADRTRIAFPIVGNGSASTTMNLALAKTGTPTDSLDVRIETDSSGEPSGTLADANATGSVAGGSLTTSLVDTTVTFAGSFTLTDKTKYWVVMERDGSIDASNYFDVGMGDNQGGFYHRFTYNGSAWADTDDDGVYFTLDGANVDNLISEAVDSGDDNDRTHRFIGVAAADLTALADSNIVAVGVHNGYTGLTPNATYYLGSSDGEPTTTATNRAHEIGYAINDTEIELRNFSERNSQGNAIKREKSTLQSGIGTSETNVSFQTIEYSIGSVGDTSDNTKLYCIVPGIYRVEWDITGSSQSGSTTTGRMKKNDTTTLESASFTSAINTWEDYLFVSLDYGDFMNVTAQSDGGGGGGTGAMNQGSKFTMSLISLK